MGQTAFDLEQPLSRRHEAARRASAAPEQPAEFVAGARPALPDTRPSGHIRRRSHRGRGLVLAVVLAVACVAGVAGISYALSHRHHGAMPPAATPPALTKQGRVVRAYFAAINDHRYLRAYRLGGHSGSLNGLKTFELGFAGTKHDIVTIDSVSGDVVTAQLRALQTDGTVKNFQGTYTVTNGMISRSNVHLVT